MTDLLRKYLLSTVARFPDDPAAPEPGEGEGGDPPADGADPAADAAAAAAAAADPAAPAAPAAPADPAAPREHGNKGKKPWYLDRISAAEYAKQQEADGRAAEKRRADAAEEMLARLQRGETTPAQPAPVIRQPGQSQDDFTRAVSAEAQRQRVYEDTIAVRDTGLEKFPDFNESLNILTAIGVTADNVVSDLIAVDKTNAHAILDKLAKDPDRAAALVAMSPQRRIAEFTRMSMAESAKAATPAAEPAKPLAPSNAPKPRPALAPVSEAPEGADFSDEKTDEDWSAAWDRKHLQKRA